MASPSNQRLGQLMSGSHTSDAGKYGTGSGEALNLEVIADSTDAQSGSFYEPFWDLEKYDDGDNLLGIDGDVYAPSPWDQVQLGEYRLPGIWSASATPAIKLDIQKPLGYDGAAVVSRGYLPASVTLTGILWTPLQFRVLQDALPGIWQKPFKVHAQDVQLEKKGKVSAVEKDKGTIVGEQKSLGVVNPALNTAGIFYVVVRQITPLVPGAQIGSRTMTIECVEYVPEPAVKPSAVKRTKGGKAVPRGDNAMDDAIKAKDAETAAANDARKGKPPSAGAANVEPGKTGE
jgi:hypothetical protein